MSYRPKKLLETIKGVSEQKATKILVEGKFATSCCLALADPLSVQTCAHGLHNRNGDARKKI